MTEQSSSYSHIYPRKKPLKQSITDRYKTAETIQPSTNNPNKPQKYYRKTNTDRLYQRQPITKNLSAQQFSDLINSRGVKTIHTDEHLLVPIKQIKQEAASSQKVSIADNFIDYSRLEKLLGDSVCSSIVNQNLGIDTKRKLSYTMGLFNQVRFELQQIKKQTIYNQLKARELISQICKKIMLKSEDFVREVSQQLQDRYQQVLQKQLIKSKVSTNAMDRQNQNNGLYATINSLQEENQMLRNQISKLQADQSHTKTKQKYVDIMKRLSNEVEKLADEIFDIKQRQVQKQKQMNLWAQKLSFKEKQIALEKQRLELEARHYRAIYPGTKDIRLESENSETEQYDFNSRKLSKHARNHSQRSTPKSIDGQFVNNHVNKNLRPHFSPRENSVNSYRAHEANRGYLRRQQKEGNQGNYQQGYCKIQRSFIPKNNQYKNIRSKISGACSNDRPPSNIPSKMNSQMNHIYNDYYGEVKNRRDNSSSSRGHQTARYHRDQINQVNNRLKDIQERMHKELDDLRSHKQ